VFIRKVSVFLYATFHTQDRYVQFQKTIDIRKYKIWTATAKNGHSIPPAAD